MILLEDRNPVSVMCCDNVSAECDNVLPQCDNVFPECDNVFSECDNVFPECDNVFLECNDVTFEQCHFQLNARFSRQALILRRSKTAGPPWTFPKCRNKAIYLCCGYIGVSGFDHSGTTSGRPGYVASY